MGEGAGKGAWLLRRAYAPAKLAGDAVDNPLAVRSTPAQRARQWRYAVLGTAVRPWLLH